MSTVRMGATARRTDPTRTTQAKAETKARMQARATKRTGAPLDTDRLMRELQEVAR